MSPHFARCLNLTARLAAALVWTGLAFKIAGVWP